MAGDFKGTKDSFAGVYTTLEQQGAIRMSKYM